MGEYDDLAERVEWLEAAVRRVAGSVSPPVTLPAHPHGEQRALSPEVIALIQGGDDLRAIQQYRQETGAGLAEAKDAIDAYKQ